MAADVSTWRASVTLSLTERCVLDTPAVEAPAVAAELEAPAPAVEEVLADEPPTAPLPPPPLRFAPPTPEALAAAEAPAPRAKPRRVPLCQRRQPPGLTA